MKVKTLHYIRYILVISIMFIFISCEKNDDLIIENHPWQVVGKSEYTSMFGFRDLEVSQDGNSVFMLEETISRLWKSDNGGQSWISSSFRIPGYYDDRPKAIAIDEQDYSLVVGDRGFIAYTKGTINEDSKWTIKTWANSYDNKDVAIKDDTYWILRSNDNYSQLLHASSPENSWKAKLLPSPNLNRMIIIDKQKSWIYGKEKLYYSKDWGQTWEEKLSVNDVYLTDVHLVDDNNIWVCASNGSIYHSLDGGQNWNTTYSNEEDVFLSIHFTDAQNGWAGGYLPKIKGDEFDGILLHTTDGGTTWKPNDFPVGAVIDIDFVDKSTGYVLGYYYIMKTNTGGE